MTRTSASSPAGVIAPLVAFSERMHGALGDRHHIASPLGAWMLLAISATATEGREREACASVLGIDVANAAALAARLLRAPHPAVASGAALWTREQLDTPALQAWRSTQPEEVVRGAMPSQAEADAWARRVSGGLIDRFPGGIEPPTAMVLATVLAARSTWREPYHVVDGNRLSRPDGKRPGGAASSWAGRLQLVLASPEASGNQIMRSPAGDLAVHRVQTKSGLVVTSVIARQEVPAREVLPAALRIATGGSNPSGMNAVSLFDLPLGHDELWSIEEYKATESERRERLQSLVPAWEAHSMHDLFAMPLEFETAARAITAMIENSPLPPQARQMAVARYTRTGFEAAAISTFNALGLAMVLPSARRGIVRRATLRFGHPFAVVAVVGGVPNPLDDLVGDTAGGPWRGLPVFSGWVAEPGEAEREDDLRGESLEELPVADLLPTFGKPASAKERSRPSWWRRLARLWSRAH